MENEIDIVSTLADCGDTLPSTPLVEKKYKFLSESVINDSDEVHNYFKEYMCAVYNYAVCGKIIGGIDTITLERVSPECMLYFELKKKDNIIGMWFEDDCSNLKLLPVYEIYKSKVNIESLFSTGLYSRIRALDDFIWMVNLDIPSFISSGSVCIMDLDSILVNSSHRDWFPECRGWAITGALITFEERDLLLNVGAGNMIIDHDGDIVLDATSTSNVKILEKALDSVSQEEISSIIQFCYAGTRIDIATLCTVEWDRVLISFRWDGSKNKLLCLLISCLLRFEMRLKLLIQSTTAITYHTDVYDQNVLGFLELEILLVKAIIDWIEEAMSYLNIKIKDVFRLCIKDSCDNAERCIALRNALFLWGINST